ncbi:Nuclear control of ATPase protein 2 [Candida viswanathii]|uniref:Nuclear control of ATPase protein 2 n=1 Tax=Candida viswanathii TaxID=5486 RepID=A0A367XX18_9ASCO|nr:Nuclear control of ATPase protein 2 [Candida viswanathii]
MDLISLGLTPKRSKKILRVINNNRISLTIKNEFDKLNSFTKSFLANQLGAEQQFKGKVNDTLLEAFQELYYLFDCENFRFEKVSNISLIKLTQIYKKVEEVGDADNDTLSKTILDIIQRYIILTTALKHSDSLIYKTLVLKSQVVYWESLNNSVVNKLLYFVQTSPVKLWTFAVDIFTKTKELLYQSVATEEETHLDYYLKIAKNLYRVVESTFAKAIHQETPSVSFLAIEKHSIQWYLNAIKFVVKFPVTVISREIRAKLKQINEEILVNTGDIDVLLKCNPDDYLSALPSGGGKGNHQLIDVIDKTIEFDHKSYSSTEEPSFLVRYWVVIAFVIFYGPSQSRKIYNNRDEILHWINYNGVEPVIGFFKNWVVRPLYEMLDILRSNSDVTITTKDSLASDVTSLETMIYEFAKDNHIDTTPAQINQDVKNGDLKIVMSRYEDEIKSPIKYLISGSLLRLILIQVQKGKVDGAVAINGIDKLLKSQQLVFGIVSISPSIFILYQVYQYLTADRPIVLNGKQLNIICLKCLNNIENLLILLQAEHQATYGGELLIEIINLLVCSNALIPLELKDDWVNDLNALNDTKFDISTKLDLVQKIWNMYGPYFR